MLMGSGLYGPGYEARLGHGLIVCTFFAVMSCPTLTTPTISPVSSRRGVVFNSMFNTSSSLVNSGNSKPAVCIPRNTLSTTSRTASLFSDLVLGAGWGGSWLRLRGVDNKVRTTIHTNTNAPRLCSCAAVIYFFRTRAPSLA